MSADRHDKALKEASAWIARLQNDERSRDDEAAFRAWLAAGPENAPAFDHVTQVWDLAGGAVGRRVVARPSRRGLMIGLGASAAAGLGVVGWSVAAAADTIRTSVGEQQRLTTAQGAQVILDTDSLLVVARRSGQEGQARLKRGRAAFSLPTDGRFFVVSTGPWRIGALAADFEVCAGDLGAAVLVNRGSVVAERGGQRIRVDAGCRLDLHGAEQAATAPRAVDVEVASAWRGGRLVLENTRLADAAASLNRYARKPIVVGPELADFRVSGAYRTGAPHDFAESAAVLANAEVKVFRDRIEVTGKTRPS